MKTYICTSCKYKRDIVEDKPLPKKCPYCSREGTLRYSKSAQDLINDMDNMDKFFR